MRIDQWLLHPSNLAPLQELANAALEGKHLVEELRDSFHVLAQEANLSQHAHNISGRVLHACMHGLFRDLLLQIIFSPFAFHL